MSDKTAFKTEYIAAQPTGSFNKRLVLAIIVMVVWSAVMLGLYYAGRR